MKLDRAHLEVAGWAGLLRVRPWLTNDIGRRIYVDPGDKRAWRMGRHHGAMDRPAVEAWRRLVADVRPDLVLDIGANYGEVVLSADYPDAEVHVFEPNPPVADRLERSVAGIATVHRVAVSDRDGTARLGLVPRSSGVSSLERSEGRGVEVPTLRIDSLDLTAQRLLFKIDVEGHEHAVLRGMARLLETTPRWAGLVEGSDLDAPYVEQVTAKDVVISSHPLPT